MDLLKAFPLNFHLAALPAHSTTGEPVQAACCDINPPDYFILPWPPHIRTTTLSLFWEIIYSKGWRQLFALQTIEFRYHCLLAECSQLKALLEERTGNAPWSAGLPDYIEAASSCTVQTHLVSQARGMQLLLPGQQFLLQGIPRQEQRSLPLNHVQTLPISAGQPADWNKENKAMKMSDHIRVARVWAVKAGAAKTQGAELDPSSTRFFFKACWHFTTGHLWQAHSRSPVSSAETLHSRARSLKSAIPVPWGG